MLAPADPHFSRSLKKQFFHRKPHISGEVRMGWDTGQEPSSPLPLRLGQEAAGMLLAASRDGEEQWGRAARCRCFVLLAPCQPQLSHPRALPWACAAQSMVYMPPAVPQPSKLVVAPETTKLPGPIAHLLDPIWPLCATEMSILLFKPENWSLCK